MGDKTGIGWTNATWTTVTGCTRVSPGCGGPGPHGGCYAEILSARKLAHLPKYQGVAHVVGAKDDGTRRVGGDARWTGLVRTHPEALDQPLRWRQPRRIFVNSMSDTFHADVPNEFIAAVFGIAAACPQHTFQILTKRAERLPEWFEWAETQSDCDDNPSGFCRHEAYTALDSVSATRWGWTCGPWPLPNVHLGVSVEDQQRADERIPHLLNPRVKAAVRWISAEPLLGPLWLTDNWMHGLFDHCPGETDDPATDECNGCAGWSLPGGDPCPAVRGPKIDWVVAGGESGQRYRTMDVAWIDGLRNQCESNGVPLFVKQDSGGTPGKQGRIPDDLWAVKEFPAT